MASKESFKPETPKNVDGKESVADAKLSETDSKDTTAAKTFFYCRWIVKWPKLMFAITLLLHCSMVAISGMLYVTGHDILKLELDGVPLTVAGSLLNGRNRAWKAEGTNIYTLNGNINVTLESTEAQLFTDMYNGHIKSTYFAEIVVKEDRGNILTRENMQKLNRLEKYLLGKNDFITINRECEHQQPYSILRFFDGTFLRDNGNSDKDYNDIPAVLNAALNNNRLRHILEPLLSRSAEINNREAISDLTFISIYCARRPLGEQLDEWTPIFDDLNKNGFEGLTVYLKSSEYYAERAINAVKRDMLLILGSILFIVLFMWFQTKSLWLTGWGIFSTLCSFITAILLYSMVFGYRYFGVFHILAIFIILGVAADNVFVFCDMWTTSAYQPHVSLAHRLSNCYKRVTKATFVTTLTTACAFLSNAFSPILSIASFGLFSGLVIIVNYISTVVFYPTVIVIYDNYFENTCPRCCRRTVTTTDSRLVVKLLSGPYYKLLSTPAFRIATFFAFASYIAVSVYFLTTLTVEPNPERYLRQYDKTEQFTDLRLTGFRKQNLNSQTNIFIVWGLKPTVKEKCRPKEYSTDCVHDFSQLYDEKFDLNPEDAQNDLLSFCSYLKSLDQATMDVLRIRNSSITGEREIHCFIQDMDDFLRNQRNTSLPINRSEYFALTQKNTTRYFEELLSDWNEEARNAAKYVNLLAIHNDPTSERKMAFAAIKVALTINEATDDFETGLAVQDRWEDIVTGKVSKMSKTMRGGFQTTDGAWAKFEQLKTYRDAGKQTVIVSIVLAWVVLVVFCENWIVGTIATVCITCICASVLGMIAMLGWKYGIIESLNTTLVVGLAIDYVVHFGVAYCSSTNHNRSDRVQFALSELGLSIISGAATTLGSSFFMLFAEIRFLFQFGIFMFGTIGFALLHAMTTFLVSLIVFGPSGEAGSLKSLYRSFKRAYKWLRRRLHNRRSRTVIVIFLAYLNPHFSDLLLQSALHYL